MPRIAIVEDDPATNDRLRALLEESMEAVVTQAFDRTQAEQLLSSSRWDLVVMDIDLGHGPKNRYAGLALVAQLGRSGCPTIVVSGMPEENLQDVALSLHAYEFIAKPINDLDFIHKVEHALAWEASDAGKDLFGTHGWPPGLLPDPARKNQLLWKGQPLRLTLSELSIVHHLVERPGEVVEARRLAKNLKSAGSPKAVVVHMSGVRKKFHDVDPDFDRIGTEPGKGYVWKTED